MSEYKIQYWLDKLQDYVTDDLKNMKDATQDDAHMILRENINNMTTYYGDSKEICSDLEYDVFQEHEIWGKAKDWSDAAFAALNDLAEEKGINFGKLDQ